MLVTIYGCFMIGQDGEIAARLGEIASLRQRLDGALGDGQVRGPGKSPALITYVGTEAIVCCKKPHFAPAFAADQQALRVTALCVAMQPSVCHPIKSRLESLPFARTSLAATARYHQLLLQPSAAGGFLYSPSSNPCLSPLSHRSMRHPCRRRRRSSSASSLTRSRRRSGRQTRRPKQRNASGFPGRRRNARKRRVAGPRQASKYRYVGWPTWYVYNNGRDRK